MWIKDSGGTGVADECLLVTGRMGTRTIQRGVQQQWLK